MTILAPPIDLLDVHRRLFCSAGEDPICWWYLGQYFLAVEGHPELLVMQAENLMIYRAETVSADSYAIHWTEIGTSTDPATNAPVMEWYNPIIGRAVTLPFKSKPYGPGRNLISRCGDGLSVDLRQPGTSEETVELKLTRDGPRYLLEQREAKRYHRLGADGALINTILSIYADAADLEDAAMDVIPGRGAYQSTFHMTPDFAELGDRKARIVVRGTMQKTRLDEILFRPMWDRIRERHPGFFDGDQMVPIWTAD